METPANIQPFTALRTRWNEFHERLHGQLLNLDGHLDQLDGPATAARAFWDGFQIWEIPLADALRNQDDNWRPTVVERFSGEGGWDELQRIRTAAEQHHELAGLLSQVFDRGLHEILDLLTTAHVTTAIVASDPTPMRDHAENRQPARQRVPAPTSEAMTGYVTWETPPQPKITPGERYVTWETPQGGTTSGPVIPFEKVRAACAKRLEATARRLEPTFSEIAPSIRREIDAAIAGLHEVPASSSTLDNALGHAEEMARFAERFQSRFISRCDRYQELAASFLDYVKAGSVPEHHWPAPIHPDEAAAAMSCSLLIYAFYEMGEMAAKSELNSRPIEIASNGRLSKAKYKETQQLLEERRRLAKDPHALPLIVAQKPLAAWSVRIVGAANKFRYYFAAAAIESVTQDLDAIIEQLRSQKLSVSTIAEAVKRFAHAADEAIRFQKQVRRECREARKSIEGGLGNTTLPTLARVTVAVRTCSEFVAELNDLLQQVGLDELIGELPECRYPLGQSTLEAYVDAYRSEGKFRGLARPDPELSAPRVPSDLKTKSIAGNSSSAIRRKVVAREKKQWRERGPRVLASLVALKELLDDQDHLIRGFAVSVAGQKSLTTLHTSIEMAIGTPEQSWHAVDAVRQLLTLLDVRSVVQAIADRSFQHMHAIELSRNRKEPEPSETVAQAASDARRWRADLDRMSRATELLRPHAEAFRSLGFTDHPVARVNAPARLVRLEEILARSGAPDG